MHRLSPFAPLLLIAALAAQDRPLVGIVVDATGAPVAGAEVTLAALTEQDLGVAQAVLVRATSDEHGRFRVSLHRDLDFGAFALGPARADGQRQVGAVQRGLFASALATVVVDRWRGATALRIDGVAAWGDAAPRQARIRLEHAPAATFALAIAADGTATLPPLPVDSAVFELLAADGQVLCCRHADCAATSIALPPPTTITFHAVDDQGRPIAGATIEQRAASLYFAKLGGLVEARGDHWRRLGATGADGTLVARIVDDADGEWVRPFRARANGHATAIAGHLGAGNGIETVDARNDRDADRAHLHFALLPARPLRGSLRRNAQEPLADQDVTVEVVHFLPLKNGGSVHVPLLFSARTGADGVFAVTDVPTDFAFARLLAPPTLRGPKDARLPSLLADATGRIDAFAPVQLDALRTVDVQVLRADGGPAEGALLLLVSLERRRWFVEAWDPRFRLDRAGRARVCPPTGECLVFCVDGDAIAHTVLAADGARVDLRLGPVPTMTVHVVDDRGQAVPSANVVVDGYGFGDGAPDELALAAVAASWLGRMPPIPTAADGTARVPCFAKAAHFQFRAAVGERKSEAFALHADDEITATLPASGK